MASTKVTFYLDDTYGLLLRSIDNLDDGGSITFENGPLFRLIARDSVSGDTLICEPSPASQVAWSLSADPTEWTGGDLGYGSADGLGTRKAVVASFSFGPFPDGDFLIVKWLATLLDSQPGRVRFSVFSWWNGPSDWAIYWQSPILLQMTPMPKDRYLLGANGGVATQQPTVDLAGDGDTYQFAPGARFEPELNIDPVDRMEVGYPGQLGTDLSAYGSRSLDSTVYIHGTLSGQAVRVRDFYDQTSILLDHQVLAQDAVTANNNGQESGFSPPTTTEAHRYVRVFKAKTEILGEDVGFDWRKWVLSSVEGSALLPQRARDRAEMARFTGFPAWLIFGNEDTERETVATEAIADEYRQLIPLPWSTDLPRYCRALLDPAEQDAVGKRPAQINDVLPNLFDLQSDSAKQDFTTHLRTAKAMFSVSAASPRRPAPYDGANLWDSYDGAGSRMTFLRVQDSLEAEEGIAYKETDTWLTSTSIVAEAIFDGTYTYIRPVASFDKSLWERFTTYAKAGHSSHPEHLGFVYWVHASNPYLYPIERVEQARFNLNYIAVAGDVTANVAAVDAIVLYFTAGHFLPGADRTEAGLGGEIASTSLCAYADDWGSAAVTPANGAMMLFGARAILYFCHYGVLDSGAGLLLDSALENPTCWQGNHTYYTHPVASTSQIQGWRRVLTNLRSSLASAVGGQWMSFDDAGPQDVLMGLTDGSSVTHRRMTLTTSAGGWGLSPLFMAALGDFVRTGFFENDGVGHITGAVGESGYAAYEAAGTSTFIREAILSDWMHSRKLVSIGHSASAAGVMGTRPDGQTSYSPLNNTTYGVLDLTSIASLIARLIQVQMLFSNGNFHGQWMPSLTRIATTSDPSSRGLAGYLGHDIGSHETGATRPYLMHCVWADPSKRRKMIAVFANPAESTRGDAYRFTPANYAKMIPGHAGAYRVTRYEFTPTGYTTKDLGFYRTSCEVLEKLDPGGVVAYSFEFVSGLRFMHRYDDDDFEFIDVPHELTHTRIEPITGQGSRFQYGFTDYHPDDDVKIASMDLRVFLLGRSQNR